MVNVNYNDTLYSFKYGARYPKWFYTLILTALSIGFLASFIPLLVIIFTDPLYENIYALIVLSCLLALFDLFFLGMLVYEKLVIKKAIMKCINAFDAKLMTVVPFKTSEMSGNLHIPTYKIGIRFKYDGKKVLMTSKKFGISKRYIGSDVKVIYSPSCDDVVILQ